MTIQNTWQTDFSRRQNENDQRLPQSESIQCSSKHVVCKALATEEKMYLSNKIRKKEPQLGQII